MKIDGKFTVWQRFEIPDEAEKDFLAFMKENAQASFEEVYDWACDQGFDPECETLEDTAEFLPPEENENCATLECYLDSRNGVPFWQNVLDNQ